LIDIESSHCFDLIKVNKFKTELISLLQQNSIYNLQMLAKIFFHIIFEVQCSGQDFLLSHPDGVNVRPNGHSVKTFRTSVTSRSNEHTMYNFTKYFQSECTEKLDHFHTSCNICDYLQNSLAFWNSWAQKMFGEIRNRGRFRRRRMCLHMHAHTQTHTLSPSLSNTHIFTHTYSHTLSLSHIYICIPSQLPQRHAHSLVRMD
jgi:hypothetical protein